jgi:type IV pilus assembly protein PilE
MHRNNRSQAGFTLVELMVTVVIVAILGSMAVAAYSNYVMKTNRTDATRAMLQDAQSLQRCYSQNYTYTPTGGCPTPAGTTASARGLYSITVAMPSATAYTITATPVKAPQTKDAACNSFRLTSDGTQSSKNSGGTDSTATCWGSSN